MHIRILPKKVMVYHVRYNLKKTKSETISIEHIIHKHLFFPNKKDLISLNQWALKHHRPKRGTQRTSCLQLPQVQVARAPGRSPHVSGLFPGVGCADCFPKGSGRQLTGSPCSLWKGRNSTAPMTVLPPTAKHLMDVYTTQCRSICISGKIKVR